MMKSLNLLPHLTGLLAAGFFAVTGAAVIGQEAASKEKPPKSSSSASGAGKEKTAASVYRVSESRANREGGDPSGSTSVTVRFEPPFENAVLVRVELTAAKDSLGNDLIDPKKATKEAVGQMRTGASERYESRVSLRLAARAATSIAELAGTAVFHDPASAKKPVTIENFKKNAGEYIPNDALKEAGISIAYLDEATFDEKGSKLIAEKVLGKYGGGKSMDEATARATAAPMKIMFQAEGSLMFVIDDPKKQLVKVEGLNDKGAESGSGMESIEGLWVLFGRNEKGISKIRLHLKSDGAEVSRKFLLKEIPLP